MNYQKIIKLLTPFLLIGIFIVSCVGTARILSPFSAERHFVNADEVPKGQIDIMVFTPDNVEWVSLPDLDNYLKENPNYSFLVPLENQELYQMKLNENVKKRNWENSAKFNVKQISNDRQFIELAIYGDKRNHFTRYEATNKEVFPKTFRLSDLGSDLPLMIFAIFVGILSCFGFKLFLKKFVNPKFNLESNSQLR